MEILKFLLLTHADNICIFTVVSHIIAFYTCMIQLLLLYHTNVNNSGTRRIKFFNFSSRKWEISKIYQIIYERFLFSFRYKNILIKNQTRTSKNFRHFLQICRSTNWRSKKKTKKKRKKKNSQSTIKALRNNHHRSAVIRVMRW